ncbi:hypothetical protein HDU93_008570, partial [Gonapodya sp. JEL0774]
HRQAPTALATSYSLSSHSGIMASTPSANPVELRPTSRFWGGIAPVRVTGTGIKSVPDYSSGSSSIPRYPHGVDVSETSERDQPLLLGSRPLSTRVQPGPKRFRSAIGDRSEEPKTAQADGVASNEEISSSFTPDYDESTWYSRLEHAKLTLDSIRNSLDRIRGDNPSAHTFRLVATTSSTWPLLHPESTSSPSTTHIVVLDSSFNPPTLAHARLVELSHRAFPAVNPATSFLVLLATTNMDKQISGAPLADRVAMMERIAERLVEAGVGNVGVGCTSAGRFLEKSSTLLQHLQAQHPESEVRLHFILGWDTLVRFFDEKYYPGGVEGGEMVRGMDTFFAESRLIIADRPHTVLGTIGKNQGGLQDALILYANSLAEPLRKYFDPSLGWVRMLPGWEDERSPLDKEGHGRTWRYVDMSSTRVRDLIAKDAVGQCTAEQTEELMACVDEGVWKWATDRAFYSS